MSIIMGPMLQEHAKNTPKCDFYWTGSLTETYFNDKMQIPFFQRKKIGDIDCIPVTSHYHRKKLGNIKFTVLSFIFNN